MKLVIRRIPIFAVGAMLGLGFAIVYWQGRHTMREAMQRPVLMSTQKALEIKIAFDEPWSFRKESKDNKLVLYKNNNGELALVKEWSTLDFSTGKAVILPKLDMQQKYRLQGYLEACTNKSNACIPYQPDIAIELQEGSSLQLITLPYLPRL